jgi:antirestriction protein ArdC
MDVQDEKSVEKAKRGFLKYYTVFNVEQCKDIPYPKLETRRNDFEPIAECERIVAGMPAPPALEHGEGGAYYRPLNDKVHMPQREAFDKPESYYAVLFHELVHSTGHKSRLDRKGVNSEIVFGSPTYCSEELVAEMGATYLCGHAGIENKIIDNSASYIDVWLSRIRKDGKILIQSASQAQKAADYILCSGGSAHGEQ